ncbi:DUF2170 family protein [Chitinivorax sp. B]|uniref:YjfI family protein n=1 Tax=Chitinivorax sp. B TaxID=2502235 RepID=UPI0020179C52|nr:DUF2170 family protein [Chitinivorax sp. B]
MDFLQRIEQSLTEVQSHMGGLEVQMQPIPGEVDVVQLTIEGRESLPIFLTRSDAQMLCICYLWTDAEVKPDQRQAMQTTMLDLNVAVPLSSFGRIQDKYVLFGALASHATPADIALEIVTLSDNSVDALDAMSDYLI